MFRKLIVASVLVIGILSIGSVETASAQARRGRPSHPPGRTHVSPQVRIHVGGWYDPGYYYGGAAWGWGWGWGWGGWPWYYPPYGYPAYYDAGASVRIQVQPRTAEVYVDGHLAGMVDDFDGIFQRLTLPAGGREITIYKEGYRSYSEKLYLRLGQGYSLKHEMERLAPGEPNEPRPTATPADALRSRPDERSDLDDPDDPGDEPAPVTAEPRRRPVDRLPEWPAETPRQVVSNFGQLAIRVQPTSAEVLVDDEPWRAPEGAERLVLHLRPGTHRVEIRKDGFDSFVTSIDVRKGETTILNVSLSRTPGV